MPVAVDDDRHFANPIKPKKPMTRRSVSILVSWMIFASFSSVQAHTIPFSQTISFAPIPAQTFGVSPVPIAAKASSGLPVGFASDTPAVCNTAGALVTLLSAGICSITASQPGNASYAAAPSVTQSFAVRQSTPGNSFLNAPGSPFAVGVSPISLAAGDFNADGLQDLVTANSASYTGAVDSYNLTVLLANSAGGFTEAPGGPFAASASSPWTVVVGDFNQDGTQDLAAANAGGNSVTVLLGNGSGGFTAAAGSPFAVGSFTNSLAIMDFNGDGTQDLVTASAYNNSIEVMLGNGSGRFAKAPGSPFTVGTSPYSLAVGDFNGDGAQDLAAGDANSNGVTVLLGNGSGGVTSAPGSPFAGAGAIVTSLVVGDFNRDGIQDLATADFGRRSVTVLLGSRFAGLTAAPGSPFATGVFAYTLAAGDFNGDGIQDLAAADNSGSSIGVLLGNGSGRFTAAETSPFAVGGPAYGLFSLAVGDFNGDGIQDVAAAQLNNNAVAVLLGTLKKLNQFILFGGLGAKNFGDPDFTVTATATSGLMVSFAAAGSCTVSGNTVHLTGAGTCGITASQAGDATHNPANPVLRSFTVRDTTPPVITGTPANISAQATSVDGAMILYPVPTATDDVDGAVPVMCTPPPGSLFPFGATEVTCRATDAHGNSRSTSFTITVADTTPPSLTTSGDMIVAPTSSSGAVAAFQASATDIVDGVLPVTCTPISGSMFPIGTSTVTCSATDTHGNAASATLKVTVLSPLQVISTLIGETAAANFQQGSALLQNAWRNTADGNMTAACNQLAAFVNQVYAQAGKSVSAADAMAWTHLTTNARAALGCR